MSSRHKSKRYRIRSGAGLNHQSGYRRMGMQRKRRLRAIGIATTHNPNHNKFTKRA